MFMALIVNSEAYIVTSAKEGVESTKPQSTELLFLDVTCTKTSQTTKIFARTRTTNSKL
jgi:hypothetical protein